MTSIFEKTMNACLESKRVASEAKKTSKTVKTESKKTIKKSLRESDDLVDQEIYGDEEIDDDVVDDVADDIMIVVDPELSEEEVSDAASDAQDIIDATPEGEVPSTDEYIGDYTYTCPICGNTFFSEVEMNDGDECPVCGEFPSGYVLVGEVTGTEEATEEEEVPVEDEELIADEPEEELIPEDTVEEESYSPYSLDESTFNPFLTKFIRENYKNAKSFGIKGAKISGRKLTFECALLFKSGKTKNVKLTIENFRPARKMSLAASEDGCFKSESKKGAKVAPFVFECTMRNRVISCTGMKYNFITSIKEGKRAQISGKLIKESKTTKRSK